MRRTANRNEPRGAGERDDSRLPFARKDGIILCAVVLCALVLRLIYIRQYAANPLFCHPTMDAGYNDQWARALFGGGYTAPRILQAVMGSLSCGLVFLIGRRYFGRRAGFVAGFVAAFFWLFFYFEGELLITSLAVFLDLLFLWVFAKAYDSRSPVLFAASGLLLGLAALARPNILLFGAFAVLWIFLAGLKNRGRRALLDALFFGAACLVPIVPVTVRNAVAGNDLVLVSSQGGVNFYIGNNPASDGKSAAVPGTRSDVRGSYIDAATLAEKEEGRRLSPSEVSRHYFEKALEFIRTEPAAWVGLTSRKVGYFWQGGEISNNQPIRFFAERFAHVVHWLPIGFGIISPLALLGLFLSFRDPRRLFPLWRFVLFYALSVVLFFVCTRFKMSVAPLLIILACGALEWFIETLRRRRLAAAGLGALALVFLFLWVNVGAAKPEGREAWGYEILGKCALERGAADEAVRDFRKGIRSGPLYDASLHINLGYALLAKGDLAGAKKEFEAAPLMRTRNPGELAYAKYGLAFIAGKRGERRKAKGSLPLPRGGPPGFPPRSGPPRTRQGAGSYREARCGIGGDQKSS